MPEVPNRLYQINPKIKIIITLRNPYKRTKLLYFHELRYGKVRGSFRQAVQARPHILNSSFYATHVQRWLKTFGNERVLILLYEQLQADPSNFMRQICNFIDVPYQEKPDLFHQVINPDEMSRNYILARVCSKLQDWFLSYHLYRIVNLGKKMGLQKFVYTGKALPKLSEENYKLMRNYFEPEITRLESMMNVDLSSWKHK